RTGSGLCLGGAVGRLRLLLAGRRASRTGGRADADPRPGTDAARAPRWQVAGGGLVRRGPAPSSRRPLRANRAGPAHTAAHPARAGVRDAVRARVVVDHVGLSDAD